MNQKEFFEKVLKLLEQLRIPYMLTGSVGAIAFGEPRLTNDMDLVVELSAEVVDKLAAEFPSDEFYFPPRETVVSEIEGHGQFNLIHVGSGSKVDFIILKEKEFSRTEFARRFRVPFSENLEATSATPEDIILSKLQYYKSSRSEKHLLDIRGILRVSGESLDMDYIGKWAKTLNLIDEWKTAQEL